MHLKLILAALCMAVTIPVFPQSVAPGTTEGRLPLTVGVSFSDFYTDWTGRLEGGTVWADWNFYRVPSLLRGIGIEVEGRDLNPGQRPSVPNLRQDTALVGPIYTWRHYRNIHPYGKFLAGLGSIDFTLPYYPTYTHDTRTVSAPGGGVEYRAWRNVWVRGDYEYQFWPDMFNHHALNPNGFTIGASYNISHRQRR